jgi:hypothetical protein
VYRTVSPRSWADWARWVPAIEPESVRPNRHIAVPVPRERFFIWPGDNDLPPAYRCVAGHVVATFEPPPNALNRLGPFGGVADDGYPPTVLYRLPRGCPEGYDPTLPPDRSPA